ncbi:sensor histidine kinase [Halopelagius longus]|uniref:histidine kinase n=1 Tax=Halopelagius longus TaxID=1236180 RepID=A0A1H1AY33_9EURY|nr:ATP-binding protein [Halopelagius longus]RDI70544.1 histidine kinase [Halopelagius longus]SDQ44076.1 His Kinase A (phospho-acceptor) domain-containing protein [Halopelagius longus]
MGESRMRRTPSRIIAALGALLFLSAVIHHSFEILRIDEFVGPIAALLVDGLPALGIVYAGYWLSKTDLTEENQRTVVTWCLIGLALFVTVIGLTLLIRWIEDRTVIEPQFTLLIAANVGSLAGFTAGYYKARMELEARQARRAKRELEEVNRRLEASNERLDQFAYVLSHDLREPLRMVSNYLQLLEDRYADDLDEDAREFVAFADDGADRMRSMIDSLLEYSRISTRGNPLEQTDADAVLDDALTDLQLRIAETDARVTADDLPTVRADPDQLAQVFRNLLTNALRHSGDEPPRVHIGVERLEDAWRFSVRDEGVGIDPESQDRIFQMFEQADGEEGNTGAGGVGLAICERIVDRHGGDIWVESEPGEWTTFSFTLPGAHDGEG